MLGNQTLVTWPHLQYNLSHVMNFACEIMKISYNVINFISENLYFKKT